MVKVLVIDDEELVRDTIEDVLSSNGYEVMLAVDGEDGISKCKSDNFDIIITDIIMPNKEGVETILEIKEDCPPGIKIIAISGGGKNSDTSYLEVAYKLGAHKVLTKPFSSNLLLQCIKDLAH